MVNRTPWVLGRHRIFEQEIVPKRRKSAIKKTYSSSLPLPLVPLPFPLVVHTIHDMEGKNLHFVTRKIFERSDIATDQNKIFISKSEVLWGFLSNGEKTLVEGRKGLRVIVVDSRGWKYSIKLKKWKSLNQIVLNGGWRKVVEDNELKVEVDCKTREKNSIFLKKGKIVISIENRKFSRCRMTKRTAPLNSSREI